MRPCVQPCSRHGWHGLHPVQPLSHPVQQHHDQLQHDGGSKAELSVKVSMDMLAAVGPGWLVPVPGVRLWGCPQQDSQLSMVCIHACSSVMAVARNIDRLLRMHAGLCAHCLHRYWCSCMHAVAGHSCVYILAQQAAPRLSHMPHSALLDIQHMSSRGSAA